MLFSFFLNNFSLTIISVDYSSFSNKRVNFAIENVKSSLVYKVMPTEQNSHGGAST